MKRVKLNNPWIDWTAVFEVDYEAAKPGCLESLDFFGDPVTREDDTAKSAVLAFLQFWGPEIMAASARTKVQGVIETMRGKEGIIPLDGSQGIRLIECQSFEINSYDFDAEEVK